MHYIKRLCCFFMICFFMLFGLLSAVKAEDMLSMQHLLERVKEGVTSDAKENHRREQIFLNEKSKQEERIQLALNEIHQLEAQSIKLEQRFNKNELLITSKRQQRDGQLGSLKELFGHITVVASDMLGQFLNSITTTQFPNREVFFNQLIKDMNLDAQLPTIEEIERLWFELHRELTASGQVVKYPIQVGPKGQQEIIRIGLFNLISQGTYLAYDADTRTTFILPRQPDGLTEGADTLENNVQGITAVGIDPTGPVGGSLLKALINTPTLKERWHQGRQVGYIITGMGIFAILFAAWRFLVLTLISIKMRRQLQQKEIKIDNPLGRILKVSDDYAEQVANDHDGSLERLELNLTEVVLREAPKINTGLSLLKIIAMVAPLLGLLGTVTGMIIVFQAITIYGAGDPRAMAGGISSALVTTVLGLIVAIPILLLHTILSDKAKRLIHIIEQQSAGIIAERAGE